MCSLLSTDRSLISSFNATGVGAVVAIFVMLLVSDVITLVVSVHVSTSVCVAYSISSPCKTNHPDSQNTRRSQAVTSSPHTVPSVVVISKASHTVGVAGKAGLVFALVMIPAGVYLLIVGTNRLAKISSCCHVVSFRTATVIVGSYVT